LKCPAPNSASWQTIDLFEEAKAEEDIINRKANNIVFIIQSFEMIRIYYLEKAFHKQEELGTYF
jgi:hypothetical protein